MEGQLKKVWGGLHVSPWIAPSKGAKLCTYLAWFLRPSTLKPVTYFEIAMPISRPCSARHMRLATPHWWGTLCLSAACSYQVTGLQKQQAACAQNKFGILQISAGGLRPAAANSSARAGLEQAVEPWCRSSFQHMENTLKSYLIRPCKVAKGMWYPVGARKQWAGTSMAFKDKRIGCVSS